MGFLKDFKAFAMRGNVVDMAVGIIIGAAFGKIVSSLVADIIMPPIGVIMGGVNFTDLAITLKPASVDAAGEIIEAVTLNYGNFIQVIVDFLIVALAIFLLIRLMGKLQRKKAAAPAEPPTPSAEEVLLTEIRDLMRERR